MGVQEIKEDWLSTKSATPSWNDRIKNRLPITKWITSYTISLFCQDLLAGFTVGLTEIPQAIAYASIAGLPSEYGLYSCIMGGTIYVLLGGCKDVNMGPTAIMALLVQNKVAILGPNGAILISFISGMLIFITGLLHLGFLVDFFSIPVITGFTIAAALNIAFTQLKSLLGVPGPANEFLETLESVVRNIKEVRVWDFVLGVVSMVVVIIFRELRKYGSLKSKPNWSPTRNAIGKSIFLVSLAGNAIVVITGGTVGYVAKQYYNATPVVITGDVQGGFPSVGLPPFSSTLNDTSFTFIDMLSVYGSSLAFCPLIAFLEHIAIVKAFTKGKMVDATQELLALGASNMAGSFFRSMPITGSFSRSAINNASGAKTTVSGLITSLMVLIALILLTGMFKYVPKSTLAAVIIVAMYYLCDFQVIGSMWRTKKLDLIPFGATLIFSLVLSLEYGIIIGIAINLTFILLESARPKLYFERILLDRHVVYMVRPKSSLYFPSAEYVRQEILRVCCEEKSTVVIDGEFVTTVDGTQSKNFAHLLDDLEFRSQRLLFWNFNSAVTDICTGDTRKLIEHFKSGEFDLVIQETFPRENQRNLSYHWLKAHVTMRLVDIWPMAVHTSLTTSLEFSPWTHPIISLLGSYCKRLSLLPVSEINKTGFCS